MSYYHSYYIMSNGNGSGDTTFHLLALGSIIISNNDSGSILSALGYHLTCILTAQMLEGAVETEALPLPDPLVVTWSRICKKVGDRVRESVRTPPPPVCRS